MVGSAPKRRRSAAQQIRILLVTSSALISKGCGMVIPGAFGVFRYLNLLVVRPEGPPDLRLL